MLTAPELYPIKPGDVMWHNDRKVIVVETFFRPSNLCWYAYVLDGGEKVLVRLAALTKV